LIDALISAKQFSEEETKRKKQKKDFDRDFNFTGHRPSTGKRPAEGRKSTPVFEGRDERPTWLVRDKNRRWEVDYKF